MVDVIITVAIRLRKHFIAQLSQHANRELMPCNCLFMDQASVVEDALGRVEDLLVMVFHISLFRLKLTSIAT